tara:strand:+ start:18 stop:350 length:333 start_codon:yes stop_codon:yes gene_type:complete
MTEENKSSMSSERFTGRVEWFSPQKGYGFIKDINTDNSYFVHYDGISVSNSHFKKLFPGEYVTFNVLTLDNGKTSCVDVRGINNGPLLTENNYNFKLFPKKNFQSSDNIH